MRKKYASNVTGAYYANRLAACEYLEKIKKQASVVIMREIKEEYYAPLGVGILREATRKAFIQSPEKPETIADAFKIISQRMKFSDKIKEKSAILANYGKQRKLNFWLK